MKYATTPKSKYLAGAEVAKYDLQHGWTVEKMEKNINNPAHKDSDRDWINGYKDRLASFKASSPEWLEAFANKLKDCRREILENI